jgi:hypothetical protein
MDVISGVKGALSASYVRVAKNDFRKVLNYVKRCLKDVKRTL